MKFFDLRTKKPKDGQLCIVKDQIKGRDGKPALNVFVHPQWFYGEGFLCHPAAKMWAAFPDHVESNPIGWKSIYRGDDLPPRSCECVACFEDSEIPKIVYFLAKDQRFVWCDKKEPIAFMEI
jgi:hypothetical protein